MEELCNDSIHTNQNIEVVSNNRDLRMNSLSLAKYVKEEQNESRVNQQVKLRNNKRTGKIDKFRNGDLNQQKDLEFRVEFESQFQSSINMIEHFTDNLLRDQIENKIQENLSKFINYLQDEQQAYQFIESYMQKSIIGIYNFMESKSSEILEIIGIILSAESSNPKILDFAVNEFKIFEVVKVQMEAKIFDCKLSTTILSILNTLFESNIFPKISYEIVEKNEQIVQIQSYLVNFQYENQIHIMQIRFMKIQIDSLRVNKVFSDEPFKLTNLNLFSNLIEALYKVNCSYKKELTELIYQFVFEIVNQTKDNKIDQEYTLNSNSETVVYTKKIFLNHEWIPIMYALVDYIFDEQRNTTISSDEIKSDHKYIELLNSSKILNQISNYLEVMEYVIEKKNIKDYLYQTLNYNFNKNVSTDKLKYNSLCVMSQFIEYYQNDFILYMFKEDKDLYNFNEIQSTLKYCKLDKNISILNQLICLINIQNKIIKQIAIDSLYSILEQGNSEITNQIYSSYIFLIYIEKSLDLTDSSDFVFSWMCVILDFEDYHNLIEIIDKNKIDILEQFKDNTNFNQIRQQITIFLERLNPNEQE